MADEPENPVLVLLHQLAASVERIGDEQQATNTRIDGLAAEQREMRTEQRAMRAEFNAKFQRLTDRSDRMVAKLDRAAVRADDVMGAQVRMQTDIAALRAAQEEGEREVADEFRQDLESLRERVDVLEDQKRG
jgi:hypothetical protein